MTYYYENRKPSLTGAKLVTVKRNTLNPLQGLTFVNIAIYTMPDGRQVGIVF